MIYLTRRERFCAAHRMFRPDFSDEKNEEAYGPCSNPEWHGHNYELFVTVKGEMNKELGYAMNLKKLKEIINKHVIIHLDHMNINTQVDFMKGKLVSTENIAIVIWEILEPQVRKEGVELHCIKITETENNYIEYYG
ncbi:MAG TPA: 6-pyruvoyl tetrahydrobiopterin synthase [Bacteroidales bacterium]|nr:6-pyruvoyl tetrahydrobiopterin synthase [Bacteroidales bacterium]